MADHAAQGPQVGDIAPDFTLPATSGHDVTLSSLRGQSNLLLAFFPLAFTGVCTTEMCDFSHDLAKFEGVRAKVFGISVDSIPTLNEFKSKHGITIDLLSDFKRDVCRAYGTLIDDLFFSRRAYFLIARSGGLRWAHTELELGQKQANQELLERIQELDVG